MRTMRTRRMTEGTGMVLFSERKTSPDSSTTSALWERTRRTARRIGTSRIGS
jgi:hypothetical protein